jgi:5-methylcytosine-specific restriction endonuclease McrA
MTTDQRKERLRLDRVYRNMAVSYKQQNPACVHCGYHVGEAALQCDHICAGVAGRAASLLNFNTINSVCDACHRKGFTRAEKAAAKVNSVLREIERLQARNFSSDEDWAILKAIVNREPGHRRT